MEMLRNVIYTACMCAIISSAVQLHSPERTKKEMKLVCTLVLIICIAAQISGFKIDINQSFEKLDESTAYLQLTEEYKNTVLEESRQRLETQVLQKLNEQNIAAESVGIVCSLDEYNCVKADSVHIYLKQGCGQTEINAAKSAAAVLLPDIQTEVEVNEA